jgi:hypothetical protein
MNMKAASLLISLLAFIVSTTTLWITLFRKGQLHMTRPTLVYFGPDSGSIAEDEPEKIYLRTLLYSTSKRGHIIENMFVRLHRDETAQNFNIWVYGDDTNLHRGSGLFVPENGVANDHHFLLPPNAKSFKFKVGKYTLKVFASEVGARKARLLFSEVFDIADPHYTELIQPGHGLYFDWGPDARRYMPHVGDRAPRAPMTP